MQKGRGLSDKFIEDLKKGCLHPILKAVQTDEDLILEIRKHYINIYYRGGNILKLSRLMNESGYNTYYKAYIHPKYIKKVKQYYNTDTKNPDYTEKLAEYIDKVEKYFDTDTEKTPDYAEKWVENIHFFKDIMDAFLKLSKKRKKEKNAQQLIVKENNFMQTSNGTDYFIIDFEYQYSNKTRFDLVGLFCDAKDKKTKTFRLVIIEVKYGKTSLAGKKSGLSAHIINAKEFLADKRSSFKKEMVKIIKQKHELGILNIKDLHEATIEAIDAVIEDTIDFLFFIAGYDSGDSELKSKLKSELKKMKPEIKKDNVLFATSSSSDYTLLRKNMKSFDEFKKFLDEKTL